MSYLQKLNMRTNDEHPPLTKVLAAAPLVVRGVHADSFQVSWTVSGNGMFKPMLGGWVFGHWLITRWNDPVATVFWARLPILRLTLVLRFVLFLCRAPACLSRPILLAIQNTPVKFDV